MKRKRGILIVAVLLSTLLVSMFIGAAISLSPFSLARGEKDQDWRLARSAAASGVEYALARLQADPYLARGRALQFSHRPRFRRV